MSSSIRYFIFAAGAFVVSLFGCSDEIESPATPEQKSTPDAAATSTLSFSGMAAGSLASCGVASDGRGYCWGFNQFGEIGDGTTTDRLTPVAIGGALRFRQLDPGDGVTCGLTTDRRAYCWGPNNRGVLGDGTTDTRLTPVAVVGGHKFSQIEVRRDLACGVSYPDGKAWCWGLNNEGQLGIGTRDASVHSSPVAVRGGHTFTRITTGLSFACGVTTAHQVYCWGLNTNGQLGDGTDVWRRQTPRLVAGGQSFVWVTAGDGHTCAVTTGNRAYCWGYGSFGQRGDGSTSQGIRTPRAVLGNHSFTKLSGGVFHTCGLTTTNQIWCWGFNFWGQLGDGTTTSRTTPHLVVGGLALNQVNGGADHTCARTTAGVGYCWGRNDSGELGNGTTNGSSTPVPVD